MFYVKKNNTLVELTQSSSGGGWNTIFPIGVTYIQYTADDNPNTLFTGTTWTDITANFDESFFRIEGGNASGFGCGRQGQGTKNNQSCTNTENYSITHNHVNSTIKLADPGLATNCFLCNGVTPISTGTHCIGECDYSCRWMPGFCAETTDVFDVFGYWYFKVYSSNRSPSGSGSFSSYGFSNTFDSETRPTNRAIKIWERTA